MTPLFAVSRQHSPNNGHIHVQSLQVFIKLEVTYLIFQNLVVKGIVKFLKSVNIDTLVVEKLNEVSKNELDTLHGVTSNIQDQFASVSSSLETAELEQTNWKTRVASAINAIPKKNPTGLTKTSALVKFESELKNTQDAIEGATAVAANVLSPKKYVGSNGYLTDGTMPDYSGQTKHWTGYENIIVQKNSIDPESQVIVTIKNTSQLYGFYNNDSKITTSMYLPMNKVAYGTRIGRYSGGDNIYGADDTNSVVGTFTEDATAEAINIKAGKIAYVKGQKVTGTLKDLGYEPLAVGIGDWTDKNGIRCFYAYIDGYSTDGVEPNLPRIVTRSVKIHAEDFGDAVAANVVAGKTFTSAAGIKVTGTVASKGALATCRGTANWEGLQYGFKFDTGAYLEGYSGGDHPMVTVPYGTLASTIGLTAGKIIKGNTILGIAGTGQTGVDTSDANATAANILKNKTAYVNGVKITGTVENMPNQTSCESIGYASGMCYVRIPVGAYLTRAGAVGADNGYPEILASASMFGDAEASHVLTGKLFTSSAGLRATGAMPNRCGFYHDGTKDIAHGSEDGYVCGYGGATSQWGVTSSENFYFIRMPNGYYGGWGRNGQAEVEVAASVMNASIGLTADKIKEGVTIAGVTGTLKTSTGTNTSDATAGSGDIRDGKSAYVNGSKIWGTMIDYNEYCKNLAQVMRAIKYCGYTSKYVHIYYVEPGATKVHEFGQRVSSYHTSWDGKIFNNGGGQYAIPNYNWSMNSGITVSTSDGKVTFTNNDSVSNCGVASCTTSGGKNHLVVFIAMR